MSLVRAVAVRDTILQGNDRRVFYSTINNRKILVMKATICARLDAYARFDRLFLVFTVYLLKISKRSTEPTPVPSINKLLLLPVAPRG